MQIIDVLNELGFHTPLVNQVACIALLSNGSITSVFGSCCNKSGSCPCRSASASYDHLVADTCACHQKDMQFFREIKI